jgi:hypothetical protein
MRIRSSKQNPHQNIMKHSLQIFLEMDFVPDNGAKMLPPWLSLGVKVPKHKL